MSSIGDRIREERERMGLSQSDFASIGGASKRSQIDWEKGVAAPNAVFLAAAAARGVDVTYVLTGVRMDEATRVHLTRAIQFSVQLGDQALTDLSIKAIEDQAAEIGRKDLMAKLEKLSEADVSLLLQMADRIAKPAG